MTENPEAPEGGGEQSEPGPASSPADAKPQWAVDLEHRLDDLKAAVTPVDHDKLGESVYKFFQRGGAFEPPEPPADDKPPTDEPESDSEPPRKGSWFSSIAKHFE